MIIIRSARPLLLDTSWVCMFKEGNNLSSVQLSSVAQLCPTLCDPMNISMPGHPVHHQVPEFTQIHTHRVKMSSSHLILCRPLLLLPPIPTSIRVFSMSQFFA